MTSKPTIAVTDDNEYLSELLEVRFQSEGWTTVRFSRGEDVRRYLARKPVDLLLLDIELPDGSGLDMLRRLRADPLTEKTPVLMLTSHTGSNKVREAIALGANGYMGKPFNMEELVRRVARELRTSEDVTLL